MMAHIMAQQQPARPGPAAPLFTRMGPMQGTPPGPPPGPPGMVPGSQPGVTPDLMSPDIAQPGPQPGGQPLIPDPVTVLQGQVAKLEQWAADTAPLTTQINPALTTLLVPIAQAGKALAAEIQNIQQRNAGPSQPVMGSVPPNVPGNIPGAYAVQ